MKKLLVPILGVLVIVAVLIAAIAISAKRPAGPIEPSWDRETCAHCRMHISERPFAAQIQTGDGRVLYFDDPGCLFAFRDRQSPEVHAVYFRHVERDEWIGELDVAFVPVPASPMGYGLGAVSIGTRGSIGLAEARRRALDPDDPGAGHVPSH